MYLIGKIVIAQFHEKYCKYFSFLLKILWMLLYLLVSFADMLFLALGTLVTHYIIIESFLGEEQEEFSQGSEIPRCPKCLYFTGK